jgi:hypothetical protein
LKKDKTKKSNLRLKIAIDYGAIMISFEEFGLLAIKFLEIFVGTIFIICTSWNGAHNELNI